MSWDDEDEQRAFEIPEACLGVQRKAWREGKVLRSLLEIIMRIPLKEYFQVLEIIMRIPNMHKVIAFSLPHVYLLRFKDKSQLIHSSHNYVNYGSNHPNPHQESVCESSFRLFWPLALDHQQLNKQSEIISFHWNEVWKFAQLLKSHRCVRELQVLCNFNETLLNTAWEKKKIEKTLRY